MKTLFNILLVFVLMIGVAEADISPVGRSTNLAADGSVMSGSEERHYINVINNSGSTIDKGSIVVKDTDINDDLSVEVASVTPGSRPICVTTASCSNGTLCKSCQTWGYYDGLLFDVSRSIATAGQPLWISEDTAGYGMAQTDNGLDDYPVGIFLDNETSTSTTGIPVLIMLGP